MMTRERITRLVVVAVMLSGLGACKSRRGQTVEYLRVVRGALTEYQKTSGSLPTTLDELSLPGGALVDGNGHPFVYTRRLVTEGFREGHGHWVVVGMRKPAKHHPFADAWWYAIVLPFPGKTELRIQGSSGDAGRRELAPFLEED